jgi:putative hemolysin
VQTHFTPAGGKTKTKNSTFYHFVPLLLKTLNSGFYCHFSCHRCIISAVSQKLLFLALYRKVDTSKKFIDIENVIGDKNPNLLRFMPGFVIRYIKRILHQDEINSFIDRNGHLTSFDFVKAILVEFGVTVRASGLENLPSYGGCIIAANHPLGGLDAMALIDAVGEKRRDVRFVVNDVLLQLKNLEDLFIGVNKHGKNTLEILETIDRLYASDISMMIFPAGLVSRKQKGGIIKALDWKKSFISKAKKHQREIIPVYIEGKNTDFFYNFARWRTRLGIKLNIEMFFLVDEMYKQRGHHIDIIFGKPISPSVLGSEELSDQKWAQLVKGHIYKLKSNPSAEFIPVRD